MICIKTKLKSLPESCDQCQWFQASPHPYKGWTDWCDLCHESMDDDAKEGWCFDGSNRPEKCPLMEVS